MLHLDLRSEVYKYDPMNDTWEKVTDIPTPRIFLSASEVDGKIYAIGGRKLVDMICLPLVEEYTPEDWSSTGESISPQGKFQKLGVISKANDKL